MTTLVYLDGRFVPENEAVVSIDDGGWLHGAGLFETMRAEKGRVFRLEAHMQRLMRSAEKLLRPIARDALPQPEHYAELLERNAVTVARLRLTLSAGSMRGSVEQKKTRGRRQEAGETSRPRNMKTPKAQSAESAPSCGTIPTAVDCASSVASAQSGPDGMRVCVTASELTTYPRRLYENGVRVIICPFRVSPSDPVAGHKTISYLPRLLALREAQSARCTEALWFTTDNHLGEGSVSNIFLVSSSTLKTPALDTPVLPGVARAAVIELASEDGLDVNEGTFTIDDLLEANEVFLTNALMGVMPVIAVEGHTVSTGRPGAVTNKLQHSFRELVQKECSG